jgi:quinohemoprotein ethanol dehydrogenase
VKLARLPVLLAVVALASLPLGIVASAGNRAAPVPSPAFTPSDLVASSGDDWLGWNGNIYNQRYSTLDQVNQSNVKQLKIAWSRKMVIPGVKAKVGALGVFAEQQPVTYQGTLYMPDTSGNTWAFDGSTGERIWTTRAKFPKGLTPLLPSRGVAQGDGKVYIGLGDATMTAMNQSTGRVVWKTKVANWKAGYYFTNAPTYYRGMVISGISGGDSGARAFVTALNARTGKELWRFYVIPDKNGLGAWTWPKKRAFLGGGAMWNTPTVDPQMGLVYVAVGNPIPYSGIIRGPGKELFTDSIIALNVRNGKLRWYYQTTHHDIWDYDATNPTVLFDLNGKKAIAQAGKTGWVYILNRSNGKPLLGIDEKKVEQLPDVHTYATQPYPKGDAFSKQCATPSAYAGKKAPGGKPYKVGCIYTPYDDKQFVAFAPSALGGANWPPSAYSPQTGYMYICSKDSEGPWRAIPEEDQKLKALGDFSQVEGLTPGGKIASVPSTGRIVAMNMRNNRIAWQVKWPTICYSGITTTAGNVLFVGTNEGYLNAYNARTGKLIWRSTKLTGGVNAPPVVYTANGKQYVAVFAGGNGIASIFGGTKPFYGSTFYAFALPS